jgi:hypothetical protein
LRAHNGWRRSWTQIIPGDFGGGGSTDLLFYSASEGVGEFYATDGQGNINHLRTHEGWRQSWDLIIPGNFGGSGRTDLLFYDATAGQGEFYTTDGQGNISLLRTHSGWRRNWAQIIPGDFGGDGRTDLLFYDRDAGQGEFYTTDGQGGIRQLRLHNGWRRSWTRIIPGSFGGSNRTDLLFYDKDAGQGEFYATDGQGGISQLALQNGWRASWTQIVPGGFGPTTCLQVHLKILTNPNIAIATMVSAMRQVYTAAGFRVNIESTETLANLPALLDIDVGRCVRGTTTAEQNQLFQNRNNVGANDVVVYFVRSTVPPFNGCATHPDGRPGAVVAQGASRWTLAHEVGHVLSLRHVTNEPCGTPGFVPTRLMTGCGTGLITGTPNLVQSESSDMNASALTNTC